MDQTLYGLRIDPNHLTVAIIADCPILFPGLGGLEHLAGFEDDHIGTNRADAKDTVERTATALKEATILSSVDGVVLVREKEEGDGISSILTAGGNATSVMTLGDVSHMYVEAMVDEVLANMPDQVAQYQNEQDAKKRKKMLGGFMGPLMKASKGQANPQMVNQLLAKKLQ